MSRYYWPNRTLCDVLYSMKECHKTRNYAPLKSLILEVQIMGERMEAGLSNIADLRKLEEDKSESKKELDELKRKIKAAKEELEELSGVE